MKRLLLIAILLALLSPVSAQTGKVTGKVTKQLIIGNKGKSAYSIFIDPAAPPSVSKAAEELKMYFDKVAGFSPDVIVSSKAPLTPFVSLGNTAAARAAGLDASVIEYDGFHMVAKGTNLYILGPDTKKGEVNEWGGVSNGTCNGVYTFIEDYLGVTWLMPGEQGEDYKKLSVVSIPSTLNRKEVSPLIYRVLPMGNSQEPLLEEWNRRMKLGRVAAVQHSHYWAQTIPPSAFEKHPEWFAEVDGKPLPPAGRYKFETTNQGLVKAYADVIIETFRKQPNLKWYSLSPSDGGGWSESAEAKALLETDPHGVLSRTKLVLKFYNDIAKIVGKEFPDRKLGGYIYSSYMYPPAGGIPKLEPNLALVLATSNSYGYQLYRPDTQQDWDKLMRDWGESAKKDGFDVYYYDLPTILVQPYGTILPPAPFILNYTFDRVKDYGYKGAYFSGGRNWINAGPGNYVSAKLEWKPGQDAYALIKNYYNKAYGSVAAGHIQKMYTLLDSAFLRFYIAHPKANYNMTQDHFNEIYGPNYEALEKYFLKALAVPKAPKQQHRLKLLGEIFSLMQWNLKMVGSLRTDYISALTVSDEEIDKIVFDENFSILPPSQKKELPAAYKVTRLAPLADAGKAVTQSIPARGDTYILLHVAESGKVRILPKDWNGKAELVHYSVYDEGGKKIKAGAMAKDRLISFEGKKGANYMLGIPSRDALFQLDITGAAAAYKANTSDGGMRMLVGNMNEETLTLYFYVPENIKDFGITLNTKGALVDVTAPDGRLVGQLNNRDANASRLVVNAKDVKAGCWKLAVHKFNGTCTITLDKELPQWFITDPAQPLMILDQHDKTVQRSLH